MHNFFILQQYVCYTKILNMFRAACCSSSGGQIVSPQPLVSSLKQPYSMPVESGLSPLSTGILYGCLQRVTIPEAVVIQFCFLDRAFSIMKTKINQQNAQINFGLIFY